MKRKFRKATFILFVFLLVLPLLNFLLVQPAQAFDPDNDIFFESGAEGLNNGDPVEPPFDSSSMGPENLIEVDDTYARTGTKSIYMYQIGPPDKDDADRRNHLREYGSSHLRDEGYISFWLYVNAEFISGSRDTHTTIGGWQVWWGPSTKTWMWWTGGRFRVLSDNQVQISYRWGNPGAPYPGFDDDAYAQQVNEETTYNLADYEDEWVHFQLYWKIAESNGIATYWFNDNMVKNITGLHSDPRYYSSSWNNNPYDSTECVWRWSCTGPYPNIGPEVYQNTGSFETWTWFDDIVASDTKVSEEYGVGYGGVGEFANWESSFENDAWAEWNGTSTGGTGISPTFVTTGVQEGTYAGNFTVGSSGGGGGGGTMERQIGTSSDDCTSVYGEYWSKSAGTNYVGDGADKGGDSFDSGFRFTNITVPQGATITHANITFKSGTTSSNTTMYTELTAHDVDNSATFSDYIDWDARVHTSTVVAWDSIGTWTYGEWYESPPLTSVVQEVTDRAGWVSGNAITILWFDNGSSAWADRAARAYDWSSGDGAILNVTYTTSGGASVGSYSRAMHLVQPIDAVFMRSFVTFEDLPDSTGTIWVLRIATSGGTWIASTGINRTGSNYYWTVEETGGGLNYTQDTINADQTYEIEIYFNATTAGNATVWINGTIMCEMTGDFSGNSIQRVYPYIYIDDGAQTNAKTIYHDLFAVDNIRIGSGTPVIFQGSIYFSVIGEKDPLQYVTVNGTATDEAGYYTWSNLSYNTVYTFVIGNITGYYPAWCSNVDGSYYWNGTNFILSHNVTATQTGYVQVYFFSSSQPYINSTDVQISSVSVSNDVMYISANDTGSKNIQVYSASRPTYIQGKSYSQSDYASNIFTITYTFSGSKTFTLSWANLGGTSIYETDGEVTGTPSYANDVLTFTINKTGTSVSEVYVGGKGEPERVTGATYTYDSATQIVTLTISHSSEEEVVLDWTTQVATIFVNVFGNVFLAIGLMSLGGIVVVAGFLLAMIRGFSLSLDAMIYLSVTLIVVLIAASIALMITSGLSGVFT